MFNRFIATIQCYMGLCVSTLFPLFQYKATDMVIPGPGKFEIVFTPNGGAPQTTQVFEFKNGGGCGMAMYNTDEVGIHNTTVYGTVKSQ